jgi:hypothetical protein
MFPVHGWQCIGFKISSMLKLAFRIKWIHMWPFIIIRHRFLEAKVVPYIMAFFGNTFVHVYIRCMLKQSFIIVHEVSNMCLPNSQVYTGMCVWEWNFYIWRVFHYTFDAIMNGENWCIALLIKSKLLHVLFLKQNKIQYHRAKS